MNQKDGELVAAEPHHHIGLAAEFLENSGDVLQQGVTDRMAERIVDRLEPVKIDQHQGQQLLLTAGQYQALFEALIELVAVGQPRSVDRSWRGR